LEIKYPFSNFSSIEEGLPGIDAFGFLSDGFSPIEGIPYTIEKDSFAIRPP
jgi:hypothetical protein